MSMGWRCKFFKDALYIKFCIDAKADQVGNQVDNTDENGKNIKIVKKKIHLFLWCNQTSLISLFFEVC